MWFAGEVFIVRLVRGQLPQPEPYMTREHKYQDISALATRMRGRWISPHLTSPFRGRWKTQLLVLLPYQ